MDLADRRRINFAVLVTLIALPVIWFVSQREGQPDETIAGGTVAAVETPGPVPDSYVPDPPVFLDGEAPLPPPALIAVDTTAVDDGRRFDGRATYQRFGAPGNTSCSTPWAPSGTTLTVRNIDNGQEIRCYNTGAINPPEDTQIVVHTDLLAQICDLADAPVPVRVSW